MIGVRLGDERDQPRLIEFLRDHWSANHIFVSRPDLFEWQHLESSGRLNMVLAEDSATPEHPILGVLGYIPMGRFDPSLGDRDLMLAIWKVRDNGAPPGLGLRLLKFLQRELTPRLVAAIGTSEMVRPIYEVLGYEVGVMHHSALFNPERRGRLRIAAGVPDAAFAPAVAERVTDVQLTRFDATADSELRSSIDRLARAGVPAKSWRYIDERYLRHPWYRYETLAVRFGGDLTSVVVWRRVKAEGVIVLRIVDIIGDPEWLAQGGPALQRLAVESDAEYVDLVQWGLETNVLETGGFYSTAANPGMVLPNYFAPFEPRTVSIGLAVKVFDGHPGQVRLYRADSDQDRPNLVAEVSDDSER